MANFQNYDYIKFFNFFQIQLFRAATSKRKEFEIVNLELSILEQIRENIYSNTIINNPNNIALLKLSNESNFNRFIGSFRKTEENYWIILRGFIVFYIFDQNNISYKKLLGHIIKPEKTIVPIIPIEYEENFLKDLLDIN